MLHGEPVFLTGASGFIGSHLTRRLVAEGAQVHALVRSEGACGRLADVLEDIHLHVGDVTDARTVQAALDTSAALTVYHLAADTTVRHVDAALSGVDQSVAVNLQGTLNVIQAVHIASVPVTRFVRMGGIEEYGHGPSPFREEQRERPVSPYSASQAAATHYAQMLQPYVEFEIVTIRPALVYGPGQSTGFFIPSLIEHFLDGREFLMTGGEQARDLIYVDDVVDGIISTTLVSDLGGEIINLSSGLEHKMRNVAEHLQKIMDVDLPARAGGAAERPSEVRHLCSANQKAKDLLGWEPQVTLPEGLARTVAWHRANRTAQEVASA